MSSPEPPGEEIDETDVRDRTPARRRPPRFIADREVRALRILRIRDDGVSRVVVLEFVNDRFRPIRVSRRWYTRHMANFQFESDFGWYVMYERQRAFWLPHFAFRILFRRPDPPA